jgi:hypothetical protein
MRSNCSPHPRLAVARILDLHPRRLSRRVPAGLQFRRNALQVSLAGSSVERARVRFYPLWLSKRMPILAPAGPSEARFFSRLCRQTVCFGGCDDARPLRQLADRARDPGTRCTP